MGKTLTDDDHFLIVDENGEIDIWHPEDCPTETIHSEFGPDYDEYTCNVGRHISWYGLDFLTDDLGKDLPYNYTTMTTSLPAGRYRLHWFYYDSGSMFEDNDESFTYEKEEE